MYKKTLLNEVCFKKERFFMPDVTPEHGFLRARHRLGQLVEVTC
jgi:hypothetical protein